MLTWLLPWRGVPDPEPAPIFRVSRNVFPRSSNREIGVELQLADVRRDGSAVGTTADSMVMSSIVRGVYVLSGRWLIPEVERGLDASVPALVPIGILGPRTVIVRAYASRSPGVVANVGARLAIQKRPAPSVKPPPQMRARYEPCEILAPSPWTNPRLAREGELGVQSIVWSSSVRGVFGQAALAHLPRDTRDLDPVQIALFDRDGTVRPLSDYVQGHPDLGGIAWVSPEGWAVARIWHGSVEGLAWLEPVRR